MKFLKILSPQVRNDGLWRFLPQRPMTWMMLGGLIYSCTLLSHVPVQYGAAALTAGTGLGLSGLSGTAFSGRASAASVNINGKDYPLGRFTWKLHAASLLTLKPCIAVTTELEMQSFNGDVCVGGGALRVRNADLSLPVVVIKDAIPLQLDGHITGNIAELEWREAAFGKLQGNFDLRDMHGFNGNNWIGLGNFAAHVENAQDAIAVKLVSVDGPVEANLAIDVQHQGGMTIKGDLAMTQAHLNATNAQGLVAMLGSSTQDGDKVRIAVDTGF